MEEIHHLVIMTNYPSSRKGRGRDGEWFPVRTASLVTSVGVFCLGAKSLHPGDLPCYFHSVSFWEACTGCLVVVIWGKFPMGIMAKK